MITQKQAVESFEKLLRNWDKNQNFTKTNVKTLVSAIHKSPNFRDYVMGAIPTEYGTQGAVDFVVGLLPLVDENKRSPLYTILAGWYYELGDRDLAFATLYQAQALDPEYSLAKLFERVFKAGWAQEGLANMRAELHPKVSASVMENLDEVFA